jgi:UDP-N-acetyl-2-amino-2-deoxyglucuronate dehydrogenase
MTLSVALIGCGKIARAHAYGWSRSGTARIVALADIDQRALSGMGMSCDVPDRYWYIDYRRMLNEVKPAIVVVSVWHAGHAAAVLAAVYGGARLVVCEKPMATNLGEAQAMRSAAQQAGALLSVSHQRRFYPGWERARELVAAGAIGTVHMIWSRVRDGLLNNGTHAIDLVRYVLGDPRTVAVTGAVQRATDRYERQLRAEDSAAATVEFSTGARLVLESDLEKDGKISANAVLVGADGLMRVEENLVEIMNSHDAGWQRVSGEPLGTAAPERPETDSIRSLVPHFGTANAEEFAQNFVRQSSALVEWLREPQRGYRCDDAQGYATLETIMAIYESARRREVVGTPLLTRVNPLDIMVESGALPVQWPGGYDIRPRLDGGGDALEEPTEPGSTRAAVRT